MEGMGYVVTTGTVELQECWNCRTTGMLLDGGGLFSAYPDLPDVFDSLCDIEQDNIPTLNACVMHAVLIF